MESRKLYTYPALDCYGKSIIKIGFMHPNHVAKADINKVCKPISFEAAERRLYSENIIVTSAAKYVMQKYRKG